MQLLLMCLVCLLPSVVWGAYLDPVVESVQNEASGLMRVNVVFAGNAGEPPVQMSYIVRGTTTLRDIREWAKEIIDGLDGSRTTAALPSLQPGQVITRTNRNPTTPTAKQIWVSDVARYKLYKDVGLLGTEAELAAMKASLESRYQSGYLAP